MMRLSLFMFLLTLQRGTSENSYLGYIKDACFVKGEAMSCIKYRALKLAKNTIFGDFKSNATIQANDVFSFVPLDEEDIRNVTLEDAFNEPRGILSEWTEIARYFMGLVREFFRVRGLRVNLPVGARTIEEDQGDDVGNVDISTIFNRKKYKRINVKSGRGKKKRLAIMIPLLNLLATMKIKMMLIPILLGVMLIKKLLLVAALLLPSLLSTLKACKHHHPTSHYSYFGSDSADFNADYGSNYAYSSGGGYGKDWPSNRAYSISKHRPTPSPVYITAPGSVA